MQAVDTKFENRQPPTYKANFKLDGEPGEGHVDISITCHFLDKTELLSWIVACSLQLLDDIEAEEATASG